MMTMKREPKLRFPGFEGEWEEIRLNKVTERVTRKNKSNETSLPLTISAEYGLISQTDFFNKTIASRDMSGYFLLKKGEFAYNKSYSVGNPWGVVKRLDLFDKGALSSLYICFSPIDSVNSTFLRSYFETSKWHREISMIAVEGARNHGLLNISVDDFFKTKHNLPSLPEQQKIADCLAAMDETINTQQTKIEQLQAYKKGLLQQLFSQSLRFPGFKDTWKDKKIGDLAYIQGGFSFKSSDFAESGTPIIRIGDVHSNYQKNLNKMVFTEIEMKDSKFIIQKGDLIIALTGSTTPKVAVYTLDVPAYLNQRVGVFRTKDSDRVYYKFLYALVETNRFINDLSKKFVGAAQFNISNSDVENLLLSFPSFPEQQKIADCLTTLDDLIELETKKLELLRQYKKGLLQQLFV